MEAAAANCVFVCYVITHLGKHDLPGHHGLDERKGGVLVLRLRDRHLQNHQKSPQLFRREAEQVAGLSFSTSYSAPAARPRPRSTNVTRPFSSPSLFTSFTSFTSGDPEHVDLALEEHRQSLEARLTHLPPDAADAALDEAGQYVPPHDRSAPLHGGQVPVEQIPQALERKEDHRRVRVLTDASVRGDDG